MSNFDNDDLINLYRASRETVDGLDSETLLAWLDGSLPAQRRDEVAAVLAASPAARALVDLLAELKPESEALATAAAERRVGRHAVARRDQRRTAAAPSRAPARRVARWSGAVAACAMVAVAVFAFHGSRQGSDDVTGNDGDRIFSMQEDRIFDWTTAGSGEAPGREGADRVFKSNFAKGG